MNFNVQFLSLIKISESLKLDPRRERPCRASSRFEEFLMREACSSSSATNCLMASSWEGEASAKYGPDDLLIGFYRYEDPAKREAMGLKDYFVKVIVQPSSLKILGAHIIGPYASSLIQELVTEMHMQARTRHVAQAMHIHPALSEVVQRACGNLMPPGEYRHLLTHHLGLPLG